MSNTEDKDARKAFGWVRTAVPVADGTLPHEAPAGGWQVYDGSKWNTQPAVTVTASTKAEADRLEAEAKAAAAAVWDAAAPAPR